ncbi:hypothetical protein Golob_023209 [Gossypium lobatum]|uniref:Uncharacterized protein n=2 Tax=Gossypium TaxID=3633 RepID=A0A7J8WTQ3_GOSAI|nr:hypothetical protein [Gossypium lobatum]MBA0678386.1 hypothetical protein [Gossypium aridum]
MASIRLFSFLILFILVLLGEYSSANTQGTDESHGLQPARKRLAKFKEAVDAAPAAVEARETKLKWGLDKKMVTVEGAKISDYQSNGKNSHKWLTGFTAFAADYHVPKSHPPKHN